MCLCVRGKEKERVCVYERERVGLCVGCVCVCVSVCVCVDSILLIFCPPFPFASFYFSPLFGKLALSYGNMIIMKRRHYLL